MAPIIDRRSTKFVETITERLVTISAIGAFLILFDPRLTIELWGQKIALGGDGFSSELKGAVVTLIIIGGFTAVSKYWLDSSAESAKKNETIKQIATTMPPAEADPDREELKP